MTLAPVTLEVIANRLEEIQRIMAYRLFHTGYSTILRESFDGSAGLTNAEGLLVGTSGAILHGSCYANFVRAILARFPRSDIAPDDAFLSNHPYLGGVSHTPDMAVATPVFVDERIIAFCTSMGHKPDVGGIVPGSSSSMSRSAFHEGILVPPVKVVHGGREDEGIRAILTANSRTPELLIGDIRGQIGCTRIGAQLMHQLCAEYGAARVTAAMEELSAASVRLLKTRLAALPDGEAEAENFLDGDSVSDDPVRIHVRIVKTGSSLTLDFSGSSPQTVGPGNCVPQAAASAAAAAVLSFLDSSIAYNQGVLDSLAITLREGSCLNPRFPAPVNSYMPSVHLIFNGVLEAMSHLAPERAIAQSGLGVGAISFGYVKTRTGESHVQYELVEVGLGGTPAGDGASLVHPVAIHETIQPIEVLETEFPVRVIQFAIRIDSAGAGEHRGGMGYVREYEVLEDCHLVSRLAQRRFNSRGVEGGLPPKLSRCLYNPGRPDERVLKGLDAVDMKTGSHIRLEQSGGAGWGNPRRRSRQALSEDIADGYVSAEAARTAYGASEDITLQPPREMLWTAGS
jgi:N-methylhydantoinase B